MRRGKATIVGKDHAKRVTLTVELTGGKGGSVGIGNAGIMPNITNDLQDVMRKHFCAFQIKVVRYVAPKDGKARPDNMPRRTKAA